MVSQMDFTPNINIPPDLFANVGVRGKAVNIPTALQGLQQGQAAAQELQRRRQMQQQMQAISQQYPQLAPFLTQETFPKIAEQAAAKVFEPGMPVYVNHQTQQISLQPQQGYQLYGNLPREHALKMWEVQQAKNAALEDKKRQEESMNMFRQQGMDARQQALAQQRQFQELLNNYRNENMDMRADLGRAQHPFLNAWTKFRTGRELFDRSGPQGQQGSGQIPSVGGMFNGERVTNVEKVN